jgi:hypothetical protein
MRFRVTKKIRRIRLIKKILKYDIVTVQRFYWCIVTTEGFWHKPGKNNPSEDKMRDQGSQDRDTTGSHHLIQ